MELLGFTIAVITLPLGTIALFWLFRPREEPAAKGSKTPEAPVLAPGGVYALINVPLVIVGVLLLVIAIASLLSAGQVAAAVIVFLIAVAIVGVVLFAKAREAQWQHREWTDSTPADVQRVDGGTLFSNPVPTVISPPTPVASQPPPIPAPQPVSQAEWTDQCSAAVDALLALRIPKKRAIDLVRRAPGATHDEILRAALRIHGLSRTQMPHSVNGHANGASIPTQVTLASEAQKQSQRVDAVAALVGLGIPSKTAVALVNQSSGNTAEELLRDALQALRRGGSK
jgi:hypothetical protein